jgi:hypothetical protein
VILRQDSIEKNSGSTGNECIGLIRAVGIREVKLGEVGECQGVAGESLLVPSIVIDSQYSQLLSLPFKDIGAFWV